MSSWVHDLQQEGAHFHMETSKVESAEVLQQSYLLRSKPHHAITLSSITSWAMPRVQVTGALCQTSLSDFENFRCFALTMLIVRI